MAEASHVYIHNVQYPKQIKIKQTEVNSKNRVCLAAFHYRIDASLLDLLSEGNEDRETEEERAEDIFQLSQREYGIYQPNLS